MRKVDKDLIEITQEIKIGENILEPGDKIKILTESKKLKEEFIYLMYDDNNVSVVEHIQNIMLAFGQYSYKTKQNFTDADAKEFGHRNINDMIKEAKEELIAHFIYTLDKVRI